jgi:hypothetical protein
VLRKFVEGIVFGAGFAIAFLAVAWIAGAQLLSMVSTSGGPTMGYGGWESGISHVDEEPGLPFHELSIEEQIEKSSVIALARFEPAPDGKIKAVFKEFLKKAPKVTFHYEVGDEYPSASFYPKQGMDRGDGLVAFFVGSPAEMRLSMNYSGDRISGLGDIPLELFRKKCEPTD